MIGSNDERSFRKRCFEGDFNRTENKFTDELTPEAFQHKGLQMTLSFFVDPNEGNVEENKGYPKN